MIRSYEEGKNRYNLNCHFHKHNFLDTTTRKKKTKKKRFINGQLLSLIPPQTKLKQSNFVNTKITLIFF